MIFKRLEVYGFKSFADKLVVDFDEGMTGIVGPNGCGKSNVADAVRWVLGEQSAKSLRGSNMQDIIFSGTSNRKSMSYCEVSLVFDNSTKVFPLEYDEVVISRKLYRSGESEYLVNRQPSRLKDIKDLLHDTGIGREGYSIIGQGKVEEIFRSKPEDRRAIFEEAAGISKFKSRKLEAERKLLRTNDNLEKLKCILLELDKQLAPLERQSRDAIKFREFKTELQFLEVNNFLFNYKNNEKVIADANARINAAREAYELKLSQVEEAEKAFRKNSFEINNLDTHISKLKDEQTRLMVNTQKMIGDGQVLAQRMEYYQAEKQRLEDEISASEKQLDEKQAAAESRDGRHKKLVAEIEKLRSDCDNLEKKHFEVIDEILKKENEIEQSNTALIDTINMLSDVKADISELSAKANALREREDETTQALSQNKLALERAEIEAREIEKDSIFSQQEKQNYANKYQQLSAREGECRASVTKANQEIRELSNGIGALQARLKLLKDYKETYEAYNGSVKHLLQASKLNIDLRNKIEGVVAEVIRTPKEYEIAIEMALGGALQNIITADESDAKFIIEFLKSKQLGRVTFLPLTSARERGFDQSLSAVLKEKGCRGLASKLIDFDRKYNAIFSGLLGKTLICEDMDSAIQIARKYDYAYKIVTLQGEVFAQGSITGGSRSNNSTDILKQDGEIARASEMYEKYKKLYEQKNQSVATLEAEILSLSANMRHAEQSLRDAEVSSATSKERLSKAQGTIDELLASMTRLNQSLKLIEEKAQEIDFKIKSMSESEQAMKGKNVSAGSIIKQSKELFGDKKQLRDTLNEQLLNFKVKIAGYEKEKLSIESEIARISEECDDTLEFLKESKGILAAVLANISKVEKELSSATVVGEDKDRNDAIKIEILKAEDYKKVVQNDLLSVNNQKDLLNKEIIAVNEKLVKEQSQLERIDGYMRNLKEYIYTEYGLTFETALPFMADGFEPSNASNDITRLKRQIASIGSVNEDAIAQFKDVQTRFSEMKIQIEDLEKAAADLSKIIEDLSKEMVERFETEFKKINASFKVIFKDLFGGGTAELQIDKSTSDDPLEAGIEIMAQPPGKNLSRISLLSGGEMTITAIAILFAILRQKPLPFCVLDEVEAALDDSNAGLVAQYIKKYSKETQFIVITHRKPTMEMADRLYGVTMQEKGVSKMVSVKLGDAVKVVDQVKA